MVVRRFLLFGNMEENKMEYMRKELTFSGVTTTDLNGRKSNDF